jgi:hypothetical protein
LLLPQVLLVIVLKIGKGASGSPSYRVEDQKRELQVLLVIVLKIRKGSFRCDRVEDRKGTTNCKRMIVLIKNDVNKQKLKSFRMSFKILSWRHPETFIKSPTFGFVIPGLYKSLPITYITLLFFYLEDAN